MRFHLGMSFKPKNIIKWLVLALFGLFGFMSIGGISFAHAYSILETDGGNMYAYDTGASESSADNYEGNKFGSAFNLHDEDFIRPWFYSPSLYFYVGEANGSILNVNANYNVTIRIQNVNLSMLGNYVNTARNTVKAENLRCAVNDSFKGGYTTSGGLPNVSNFGFYADQIQVGQLSNEYVVTFHINFNYQQKIPSFSDSSTNASCWFVRSPSDGLFYQIVSDDYTVVATGYGGEVSFSLTNDMSETYLYNISDDTKEIKDYMKDSSSPTIDNSTFGDLDISSNSAISGLITMPITILQRLNNNLGSTCTPYVLPFGLTGGNETVTFPCIHPEEYLGSTIWNYIDLFICFFMIYNIAMLIISSFESITSLEDTFASLYEPKHADTGYKPKHGGDD